MRLTFQGAMLCTGNSVCKCYCCDVHERITPAAIHDECRDSKPGCALGRYREIFAHDGGIVDKGWRDRFPHRPHGMLADLWNLLCGHPRCHHPERHGVASTTFRKYLPELLSVIHPYLLSSFVRKVRLFIH